MKNDLLKAMTVEKQSFKYFHILCAIYIAGMITSLTVSARLLPFHIPFTRFDILLTAGTWTMHVSLENKDCFAWVKSVYPVRNIGDIFSAYECKQGMACSSGNAHCYIS